MNIDSELNIATKELTLELYDTESAKKLIKYNNHYVQQTNARKNFIKQPGTESDINNLTIELNNYKKLQTNFAKKYKENISFFEACHKLEATYKLLEPKVRSATQAINYFNSSERSFFKDFFKEINALPDRGVAFYLQSGL